MILLLNGAFGIGKTVVARAFVARLPGSLLFDPEMIGIPLQRVGRLAGRTIGDFQDLVSWRRLTVKALRAARMIKTNVVVPMAFSNVQYLREVQDGLARFEPNLHHFCLVAPLDVVETRLRERGTTTSGDGAWAFRRAAECCAVHSQPAFAQQVSAVGRSPDEIAAELMTRLSMVTKATA